MVGSFIQPWKCHRTEPETQTPKNGQNLPSGSFLMKNQATSMLTKSSRRVVHGFPYQASSTSIFYFVAKINLHSNCSLLPDINQNARARRAQPDPCKKWRNRLDARHHNTHLPITLPETARRRRSQLRSLNPCVVTGGVNRVPKILGPGDNC